MRVLLTGFTRRHAVPTAFGAEGNDAVQRTALHRMFEALGHTVENRKVVLGETVDHDLIVMGIAREPAIVNDYMLGCLDVIARHDNLIFWADDWAIYPIQRSFERLLTRGKPNPMISEMNAKNAAEVVPKYLESCFQGAKRVIDIQHPFLASCRGDFQLAKMRTKEVFQYDPHPFLSLPKWGPAYEGVGKEPGWLVASLVSNTANFVAKQEAKLSWPILYYGNKKVGLGRCTESQQLGILYHLTGNLQVPHPGIVGVGWWRKTPWFSQATSTVLSMGIEEAKLWGEPYVAASNPLTVEALSASARETLVREQRECFWQNIPYQETELNRFREFLLSVGYK